VGTTVNLHRFRHAAATSLAYHDPPAFWKPESKNGSDMLDTIGPGQIFLAESAYDSDALRQALADRGAWANIKPMPATHQNPRLQPAALSPRPVHPTRSSHQARDSAGRSP
jgi:hypothetical protein